MIERLKQLIKATGLTQGEFAKNAELTQGHLSDIVNGRKNLTDRSIKIICLEFNVNENWLRTGEGDMFIEMTAYDEVMQDYELDDVDKAILNAYIALPKKQKQIFKSKLVELAKVIERENK